MASGGAIERDARSSRSRSGDQRESKCDRAKKYTTAELERTRDREEKEKTRRTNSFVCLTRSACQLIITRARLLSISLSFSLPDGRAFFPVLFISPFCVESNYRAHLITKTRRPRSDEGGNGGRLDGENRDDGNFSEARIVRPLAPAGLALGASVRVTPSIHF